MQDSVPPPIAKWRRPALVRSYGRRVHNPPQANSPHYRLVCLDVPEN